MRFLAALVLAASATLPHAGALAQARPADATGDDEVFLALRDAARRNDAPRALELAARLENHPIPSYIEYYRLKPRLEVATDTEIREYLLRYRGSAIADRLRNDWLLLLGQVRDWATFDEQYPLFELDDDTQLKCYALMSAAAKGKDVAAQAHSLLTSPRQYGEACAELMADLAKNGQFKADDIWTQVRLAAEHNQASLARRLADLVEAPDKLMEQALERPARVLKAGPGSSRAGKEAFLVALGRSARSGNSEPAVTALRAAARKLSKQEEALGWAQIALQASLRLEPEAAGYWSKAQGAPLSRDGHQWKVRVALRAGDWKRVAAGIAAMPASLRDDGTWIYWLGRAERELGNKEGAHRHFETIASQTNFYGQLALEELGRKITIPEPARPPLPEEVAEMAANRGFRDAFRFFDMNLRFEGYREWNWQLRGMNERQLLAAAEFARQNNVLDRMVNTSDRTRQEVDFTQRFPAPHKEIMQAATGTLGLDPAWVYGLIRQESRFVMAARSHVGASGLMQLMPATAREVARKIGMEDFHHSKVNDIRTNILLGTNYLNMVLARLGGSQTLATAAYNAGPRRPMAWRATLERPVEGAIFAETIPFSETRGYVKNVLSNATYYAGMFEGKPQSLKERLGMVTPEGFDGPASPEPL
ncbi:MAG: transglycosylase SLT domain-containing protein [Noviherbaspirillum sp.]